MRTSLAADTLINLILPIAQIVSIDPPTRKVRIFCDAFEKLTGEQIRNLQEIVKIKDIEPCTESDNEPLSIDAEEEPYLLITGVLVPMSEKEYQRRIKAITKQNK